MLVFGGWDLVAGNRWKGPAIWWRVLESGGRVKGSGERVLVSGGRMLGSDGRALVSGGRVLKPDGRMLVSGGRMLECDGKALGSTSSEDRAVLWNLELQSMAEMVHRYIDEYVHTCI